MKFASFHLRAYGPFNNVVLDFEKQSAGLQIIYGANEAGKSSALRAITALLFGIPAQTEDHFGRDYSDLRIGAVIVDGSNKRVGLMRRKANKKALFGLNPATGAELTDQPIGPELLAQLLGGVDEVLFGTLFGLDHQRLRDGGESLVQGKGDLGQAIFEAGSGLTDIRTMLQNLDEASRAIFSPTGRNQIVPTALRQLDEAQTKYRDAIVRPREWKELDAKLTETRSELGRLQTERSHVQTEESHKQRLVALRPLALSRQSLVVTLQQLESTVLLPSDSESRRAAAQSQIDSADQAIAQGNVRIAGLNEELKALTVSKLHLDNGSEIEALYHEIEQARAEGSRLPRLGAALDQKDKSVHALLAAIAPGTSTDEAAKALLPSTETVKLRGLARALQDLETRSNASLQTATEAQKRSQEAKIKLSTINVPGDVTALEGAVTALQSQGNLEALHSAAKSQLSISKTELDRICATLGKPNAADLASLPVPQRTHVTEYKAKLDSLAEQLRGLDVDEQKLNRDIKQLQTELGRLKATGQVATVAMVQAAREEREVVWVAVRQGYVARSATVEHLVKQMGLARALPEEFEARVRNADEKADLLHADTTRATRYAELESRIADMASELRGIAERRTELQTQQNKTETEWRTLLQPLGVSEMSPASFGEWLQGRDRALERLKQYEEKMADEAAALNALTNAQSTLQAAYTEAKVVVPKLPSFAALLAHAAGQVKAANLTHQEISQLQRDSALADKQAMDAVAAIEQCEQQKRARLTAAKEALLHVRLDQQASPETIESRLGELEELGVAIQQASEARSALKGAQDMWDDFCRRVATLASKLSETKPTNPEGAPPYADTAYAALQTARNAKTRAAAIRAQIETETNSLAVETAQRTAAAAILTALCKTAGCNEPALLPAAIESSELRRRRQAEFQDLEKKLREYPIDKIESLLAEATAIDPEALRQDSERIRTIVEGLEPQIRAAHEAEAAAQTALKAIDGASRALVAREEVEDTLARLRRESRNYARIRLAHSVLALAIQSFQERTQAPLLQHASKWFAQITGNRYAKLLTDYDDERQIIVAERPDGRRLKVPQLSEGTADQLYLALRFAALELRLAASEPLPLILDDALITFDNERAVNALRALARMGERNQVLLFTHHSHLVELAKQKLAVGSFAIHELNVV